MKINSMWDQVEDTLINGEDWIDVGREEALRCLCNKEISDMEEHELTMYLQSRATDMANAPTDELIWEGMDQVLRERRKTYSERRDS